MFFSNWDKKVTCQFQSVRGTWRAFVQGATWSVLEEPGFSLQWLFSVGLAEGRGQGPRSFEGPFLTDLDDFVNSALREGERPCYLLVSVHVGKKQNKTPPLSSLGPLLNLSAERNQGCPEIENVAENWDQIAHSRVRWRMLSHIRTQECAGPCPAGCLKVTPTRPCWETTQCVCLRVLYTEGTVRWALPPLFLLLPDRLCPRAPPGDFSTCYFWTVLLFAVFSSKFVLKGPTWHRKCGCGLIPSQSNWIWARKKVLPHFRGEASVFVLLPPSGGVEAEWVLRLSWSPRTTQDSEGDSFCGALAMRHFFLCKPHSPQHRGEVLLLLFCRCDSGRKGTHLWVNE